MLLGAHPLCSEPRKPCPAAGGGEQCPLSPNAPSRLFHVMRAVDSAAWARPEAESSRGPHQLASFLGGRAGGGWGGVGAVCQSGRLAGGRVAPPWHWDSQGTAAVELHSGLYLLGARASPATVTSKAVSRHRPMPFGAKAPSPESHCSKGFCNVQRERGLVRLTSQLCHIIATVSPDLSGPRCIHPHEASGGWGDQPGVCGARHCRYQ